MVSARAAFMLVRHLRECGVSGVSAVSGVSGVILELCCLILPSVVLGSCDGELKGSFGVPPEDTVDHAATAFLGVPPTHTQRCQAAFG